MNQQAKHALDRLTYGARPGEAAVVKREGLDRWLVRQLTPENWPDRTGDSALAAFKVIAMPVKLLVDSSPQQDVFVRRRRAELGLAAGAQYVMTAEDSARYKVMNDLGNRRVQEILGAKMMHAVMSEHQLQEVMTDFWENHFSVFRGKMPTQFTLLEYDRDVIRPRALGNFRDLLGAVAHSAAMLYYLDNASSTADSAHLTLGAWTNLARARTAADSLRIRTAALKRRGGLNENYGRELMELHTLGVASGAKGDEIRWMRLTLGTVGRREWPRDRQGRSIYPPGFEELAAKLERPLSPPGRDVRCIVSVGMLTEGWDANTVTHIIGIRPFMSQLLCEQVVGRGLRRASYEVGENGLLSEEVAQVFGVPFELIPFKGTGGPQPPKPKRFHVVALDTRSEYEIRFPRVEGYTQAVRDRVVVRDWDTMPTLKIVEGEYPTFVETRAYAVDAAGRSGGRGPGGTVELSLDPYNQGLRVQRGIFEMTAGLTRSYLTQSQGTVPAHVLFPQLLPIVERFVRHHVAFPPTATLKHLFINPFYGWAIERLVQHIVPDETAGEAPELPRFELNRPEGSTADVDYWTSKNVRETKRSHVNCLVADTTTWEQQAGFYIEQHKAVEAYVKNAGLGFTIPYLHDGQTHDYVPDFILRLVSTDTPRNLILETKGYYPLDEVKEAAAHRWCAAVNADGRFGQWRFAMARKMEDVPFLIEEATLAGRGKGEAEERV